MELIAMTFSLIWNIGIRLARDIVIFLSELGFPNDMPLAHLPYHKYTTNNTTMLRVAVAVSFLTVVTVAQNCSETELSVLLNPIAGTRPSSIHYTWLQDSDNETTIATDIDGVAPSRVLCAEGCSQLVFAESTWQPHFDRGSEVSGLELDSEGDSTIITSKRFAKAEFGCEPLECGVDEVLVEAYVHIKGEGSVAVQTIDTVLMETPSLGYHQSCQPASACTSMCFASTGDNEPLYATGRVLVDGKIVFDKDLEAFDCQGASAVQIGNCSAAELFTPCEASLLTVEIATDGNGPYSPYGVSWGVMKDGIESTLSPPNESNGYESNSIFKESYCISQLECTDFFIDNQYSDATFQVRLFLDGEEFELESAQKGMASQALTECSEIAAAEEDSKLSGGAIAGIVIAVLFCCCCVLVAAVVNEQYS